MLKCFQRKTVVFFRGNYRDAKLAVQKTDKDEKKRPKGSQ